MNPDDIQQIGRIISVLSVCQEKLENIMVNSGEGTIPYTIADNATEWLSYTIEEVAKSLIYRPTDNIRG